VWHVLLLLLLLLHLQSGPVASQVHGLDRHDFAANPRMSESKRQLPAPFQGRQKATGLNNARTRIILIVIVITVF
jgi:hypothetical protein